MTKPLRPYIRNACSPGEILLHEFLLYKELFSRRVQDLMTDHDDILQEIVGGRQRVDNEVAVLLSSIFGTSSEFWLNLQKSYDESTTYVM